MNSFRARLATCCAVPFLALAMLAAPAAAIERAAAARADLLAGPSGVQTFVRPDTPTIVGPASATFKVTYTGFSAAAKAAFQRAVNLWAQKISSPVTITVAASFEPLGTGILGSAGPNFFWHDFPAPPAPIPGMSTRWRTSSPGTSSTRRPTSSPDSAACSRTGTSAPGRRRPTPTTSPASSCTSSATAWAFWARAECRDRADPYV